MKKILLFASALAGLFLAGSCQRENLEPEQMAGTVRFTVEAPGAIATKTIADGQNVDVVHYAVYKTKSDETHAIEVSSERPLAQGFVPMSGKKANINFDLLQDQYYTIIFWAQVSQYDNGQNDYYELGDLRAISMKKDAENNIVGNEEGRAAFFAWYSFDTKEHRDHVVTLKRPFAQLNLLTTLESLKPVSTGQTSGYEIVVEKSTVTVEGLTSTFYPYAEPVLEGTQGKAEETKETFTFTLEDTPAVQGIGEGDNDDLLYVNDKAYHYVSMNYFFVPVDQYIVNISYALDTDKGNIEHNISSVPVKKNYRTNVIGNLLTKESKFEIVIDERFAGDEAPVEVWDGREVSEPAQVDGKYVISTAAELAWLSAAVNGTLPPVAVNGVAQPTPAPQTFAGKTFMLLEDINLDNPSIELPNVTWTPIGATGKFEGTFDGNGKTIYGLKVVAEGKASAGLFANAKYVKNVTVDGAQITGQYKTGVIVGDGLCSRINDCKVLNSTVTVTPYDQDEANNVGGIVGYLSAENEAWVKNCTVEHSVISGYRKVGGIAGAANQAAVVTGNTVAYTDVIADQTYEYKDSKAADLGEIVGYKHAKATVEPNTVGEKVNLIHKVNSVEELVNHAEGAFVYLANGEYNLTDDVTVNQKSIQINEGNVVINGHDYNITSGSAGNYALITKGANASLVIDASVTALGGGVSAANNGKVVFNGQGVDISKYTTSSPGRYNFYATTGGEIVINSGTFKFNSTNNTRRAYVCVENGGKVIINGGTFGKASTRSGYTGIRVLDAQSEVIVKGGTFGFDPTEWVAAGYTAKKDGNNWVVVSLSEPENLKAAVAVAGATVKLAAGEYTFPSSNIAEGVTIECEPGTVFTGNSKLNIKGSTVIGATFSNPSGTAVDQTINGTFKDCTFTGSNAVRYAYAGETCYFENCVFSGNTYGFHFDGGANDAYFKNCTFSGFNAFGAEVTLVTFDGCKFVANGKSGYNGANLWGSAKMINTEFVFDGSTANEWIDMIGVDKTYEMTDCTLNGGSVYDAEKIFSRNSGTKITIDGVLYTWAEGDYLVDENGNVPTTSAKVMQAALNSGANVTLNILNDIAGDVTVPQNAGVNAVINGNGKNYEGVIVVDGKSATYTTAGLTIKGLTFNASSISADACIRLGDGTNATRYTCNVTVENCIFAVPGAVGVKSYTGGDKNLTISGCTATAAAHSLLQAKGIDGILVKKCTINSKNGLNFNNSTNVLVEECNADVRGYAARFGEGSAANGGSETYEIKNSTLKSACEDGDAVIMLRGTADNSTLTLTNTTLVGTIEIANNAVNAQVIR